MDAEPIYAALFELAATLSWSGGAIAFASRRVKTFDDLPAQPALCQAETDEAHARSLDTIRRWFGETPTADEVLSALGREHSVPRSLGRTA